MKKKLLIILKNLKQKFKNKLKKMMVLLSGMILKLNQKKKLKKKKMMTGMQVMTKLQYLKLVKMYLYRKKN